MRIFSSEPLYSIKNRLKKSFVSKKLEDQDYQEGWLFDEEGLLPNEANNREPNN